jgi:hypothetical protein
VPHAHAYNSEFDDAELQLLAEFERLYYLPVPAPKD